MGPTRPLTDCITEAQLTKLAGARTSRPRCLLPSSARWRPSRGLASMARPHHAIAATPLQHRHQLDGTDIIREGDEGKTFYVISSGTVEVTIKDMGK